MANTQHLDVFTNADYLLQRFSYHYFYPEMTQLKTLYIFLAKQTVWFSFDGKRRCLKPASKPLDSERILELCREFDASKIILFLEFPWVLTHFEITITLSPDEMEAFARMRLGFHDNPKGGVKSTRQELHSSLNRQEIPVGGIYFKQAQLDRIGLLCAILSAESLNLKKKLKQKLNLSVEAVPLVVACMPILQNNPENSLIFKGLEQSFYVEKTDGFLTKLVELPAFGKINQELFVSDQLPLNSNPQTFQLLPEEMKNDLSENIIPDTEKRDNNSSANMHYEITVEFVLSAWKGLAQNPKSGFWWASFKKSRRLKQVGTWWNFAGVLILAAVVGAGFYYYQTLEQKKVLQQELSSLELELEQHINNSPSRIYSIHEKHLEQLEEIAKKLVQESFWKQQTLQTLFSSIEDAWLERFEFKDRKLRLELLALEPINAVNLFLKLSKMPETAKVHFKSQRKTSIKGHELIKFKLLIDLAPPSKTEAP